MISKIKFFRLINNGISNIQSSSEKKRLILFNLTTYLIFILTLIYSVIYFFFNLYVQTLLNLIIIGIIAINYFLIKKGIIFFSKFIGIQFILVFLFLSNVFYPDSKSLIYLYTIVIVNVPIYFSIKEIKYIVFLIAESIGLFFFQFFYKHYFLNLKIITENTEFHNQIVNYVLISYLLAIIIFHSLIIQYYDYKIKNYTKSISKSNNQIKLKNEELQKLGLAITHSLKTPLIITNGFFNKIKKNLINNQNLELNKEYLKVINDSNLLINQYSRGLMAYNSVVTSNDIMVDVEISKVIDEQIKIISARFENAKIVNKINNNIKIKSSRLNFQIITQILIENALIYNDSKIPTIIIYDKLDLKKRKVEIFFMDNGVGIADEFKENIFSPFVRINAKKNIMGSGLGLTIAKISCEKIGGKLSLFDSNLNGTIFKITLKII